MIAYEGEPCLGCGEPLHDTDDIVVCPECGTPYHRSCYHKAGKCVNTALHQSGGSWQIQKADALAEQKRAEKREEQAQQAAEREHGNAPKMFYAELYDGVRINPDAPCAGLDPAEEHDGVTMGELSEFVATNKFYYLPLFRLMQKTGKKISFNLSGLFFPQLYFANRKMWAMTLVSILCNLLCNIPTWLVFLVEEMNMSLPWLNTESTLFLTLLRIASVVGFIFPVLCCLLANYWYYRFSVRKIHEIKKAAAPDSDLGLALRNEGGTSLANMGLAIVIQLALIFALLSILVFVR